MQPTNKYYPPEWTPDKGTANKFVGKHPLGDRARKLDKGILIVRFELPFNIWCTGCDNHIGQGVRYNAEKKQIGKYYSTPILQFRMKCHLCSHWIEIHTDPKNTAYVVVSGARQKVETWTPDKDDHIMELSDPAIKEKLAEDPIYRLEHGLHDKAVSLSNEHVLTRLEKLNSNQWKDPYTQSQHLRHKFREEKKKNRQILEQTNQLKDKYSLHIDLLAESDKDLREAKLVDFSESGRSDMDQQKLATSTASLFSKHIPPPIRKEHQSLISPLKDTDVTNLSNGSKSVIDPKMALGQRAIRHTKLKTDPFLQHAVFNKRSCSSTTSTTTTTTSSSSRVLEGISIRPAKKVKIKHETPHSQDDARLGLVNYSDSGTDSDST
ncbi:CWC16 protein [Absidia repens]|uniref:CWC16 protein n=1 Tax=Absidia repens TaxID=90262 RepID=A0A1X2IPT5_9FUNG|nr:CWC16 protein [Absidia repens]